MFEPMQEESGRFVVAMIPPLQDRKQIAVEEARGRQRRLKGRADQAVTWGAKF